MTNQEKVACAIDEVFNLNYDMAKKGYTADTYEQFKIVLDILYDLENDLRGEER